MIRWVPRGSWPRVTIDPNMEGAEGLIPVDASELAGAVTGDWAIAVEPESETSALARVVRIGSVIGLISVDWGSLRDDSVSLTYSGTNSAPAVVRTGVPDRVSGTNCVQVSYAALVD